MDKIDWEALREAVMARALRMGLCREDAEDLTQDCLVRLVNCQDRLEGNPLGYALQTLTRLRHDRHRHEQRRPPEILTSQLASEAVEAMPAVTDGPDLAFMALRSSLPPRLVTCLRLTAEGLTTDEVAHQTGVAGGTVRARLRRARELAREALALPAPRSVVRLQERAGWG